MDFGYQAIETEKAQNNISEMEMKKMEHGQSLT